MDLTKEQMQQVNIAVARDMGLETVTELTHTCEITVKKPNGRVVYFNIFNPYNTTDLNKAVEAYGIDVCQGVLVDGAWECWGTSGYKLIAKNKSRDESMRMAMVKVSGVKI